MLFRSHTCTLHNCEKINVCCLSYSDYGILFQQSEMAYTKALHLKDNMGRSKSTVDELNDQEQVSGFSSIQFSCSVISDSL